jgi:adenosyl cobinamide kinase/adenosyl cobinamide phosphate guanylyltransferase
MNPNILIVGASGSGKSSSLRNLLPDEVFYLNVERKTLPFKKASTFKNEALPTTWKEIKEEIETAKASAQRIIVVDSFTSIDELLLAHCRSLWKGFDIYSNHNRMIRELIASLKLSEKLVIIIGIDEIVEILQPGGSKVSRRVLKVEGRELQGTIEKEFVIVFFTDIKPGNNGKTDYRFCVNTDGINTAKSPMEMFSAQFIDNDLALVVESIKKYYL